MTQAEDITVVEHVEDKELDTYKSHMHPSLVRTIQLVVFVLFTGLILFFLFCPLMADIGLNFAFNH